MTTVKTDIPDQQAAALSEKAAAQGMTLESWFQTVAEKEAGRAHAHGNPPPQGQHGSVVEEMRKLRESIKADPECRTTRDYVNYGRR